jgi:hypothetical protein
MNQHHFEKIYSAAIKLYQSDKSLTNIKINLIFADPIHEVKTGILNIDFRNPNRIIKKTDPLEKNPFYKSIKKIK